MNLILLFIELEEEHNERRIIRTTFEEIYELPVIFSNVIERIQKTAEKILAYTKELDERYS